jgi:hypothetical protein
MATYRNPNTKRFAKATETQCVVKDLGFAEKFQLSLNIEHAEQVKRNVRKAKKRRARAKAERIAKKRDVEVRNKKSLGENPFKKLGR